MTPKRPTEKEGVVEETGRSPQRDPGRDSERDGRERPRHGEDVDGGPDPSDADPKERERDPDYATDDDLELGAGD